MSFMCFFLSLNGSKKNSFLVFKFTTLKKLFKLTKKKSDTVRLKKIKNFKFYYNFSITYVKNYSKFFSIADKLRLIKKCKKTSKPKLFRFDSLKFYFSYFSTNFFKKVGEGKETLIQKEVYKTFNSWKNYFEWSKQKENSFNRLFLRDSLNLFFLFPKRTNILFFLLKKIFLLQINFPRMTPFSYNFYFFMDKNVQKIKKNFSILTNLYDKFISWPNLGVYFKSVSSYDGYDLPKERRFNFFYLEHSLDDFLFFKYFIEKYLLKNMAIQFFKEKNYNILTSKNCNKKIYAIYSQFLDNLKKIKTKTFKKYFLSNSVKINFFVLELFVITLTHRKNVLKTIVFYVETFIIFEKTIFPKQTLLILHIFLFPLQNSVFFVYTRKENIFLIGNFYSFFFDIYLNFRKMKNFIYKKKKKMKLFYIFFLTLASKVLVTSKISEETLNGIIFIFLKKFFKILGKDSLPHFLNLVSDCLQISYGCFLYLEVRRNIFDNYNIKNFLMVFWNLEEFGKPQEPSNQFFYTPKLECMEIRKVFIGLISKLNFINKGLAEVFFGYWNFFLSFWCNILFTMMVFFTTVTSLFGQAKQARYFLLFGMFYFNNGFNLSRDVFWRFFFSFEIFYGTRTSCLDSIKIKRFFMFLRKRFFFSESFY